MKKWLLIGGMLLAGAPAGVQAQGCAVCTKTASELDSHSARGLNGGILYLAFLPLADSEHRWLCVVARQPAEGLNRLL